LQGNALARDTRLPSPPARRSCGIPLHLFPRS